MGHYNGLTGEKDLLGLRIEREIMLEKPDINDEKLTSCLRVEFGLQVEALSFLPLGADANTAVYRAETGEKAVYFVKLRCGEFDEASVAVPKTLSDLGMRQVIPPLPTLDGRLWAHLAPYHVILYPYVEGRLGYERKLTEQQWIKFGAALKQLHTAQLPAAIISAIPRETFSSQWRDAVKVFLERVAGETYAEPAAAALAAFLRGKRAEVLEMIARAERLAHKLREQPPEFILCHGDIHGWNLLIDEREALYIVDWDTLIFAPKERDLMFIGGGLGNSGYTPQEEEALFYQGYGDTTVNQVALAYYRYERILEDIAAFCEQIFLSEEGGEDRQQALEYVRSNFLPGGTIEQAYQTVTVLCTW